MSDYIIIGLWLANIVYYVMFLRRTDKLESLVKALLARKDYTVSLENLHPGERAVFEADITKHVSNCESCFVKSMEESTK